MLVCFHSSWINSHKTLQGILGLGMHALRGWSTWRETRGFGKQSRRNQPSASSKACSVKVSRGKLPDLLLPLMEAGREPWGSGAPFPGLPGAGNSMALSYREAKTRTLIAFPKHLYSGVLGAYLPTKTKAGLQFGNWFVLSLQLSCQDAKNKLVWINTKYISSLHSETLNKFPFDSTICSSASISY